MLQQLNVFSDDDIDSAAEALNDVSSNKLLEYLCLYVCLYSRKHTPVFVYFLVLISASVIYAFFSQC